MIKIIINWKKKGVKIINLVENISNSFQMIVNFENLFLSGEKFREFFLFIRASFIFFILEYSWNLR